MVQGPLVDNEELHNRDLSRKPVTELSIEERRELKRRFEEFVTAMRKGRGPAAGAPKPAPKPIKWDPRRHLKSKSG